MPLLSLLQASPLRIQAAHLSFQEFFAARAVCKGRRLHGTQLKIPPWQLPRWWSNAVRLGVEMGEPFGRGMVEAAGETLWFTDTGSISAFDADIEDEEAEAE